VANVLVVLVVVLVVVSIGMLINRRRHGIVAERGLSVGADLGTMNDAPRVRVRAVTATAADRVRLELTPDASRVDGRQEPDLEFVVILNQEDFGFELLQRWLQSEAPLAMALPGRHLVRLRSIDDLQPITLRRVDE
jgi:hypothetical protein